MKNVVFDLGGVLVDWDPRRLYKKIFETDSEITDFFKNICNQAWNEQQDAGRSFTDAVLERVEKFPEFETQIKAYDERWEEMISG